MTCIIGHIEGDKMYMIGDSAGVSGLDITIRKDPKVFKREIVSKGSKELIPMLIGFTTSFRMGQILMYCDLPKYEKGDTYRYMVQEFIPSIIKAFKKSGFIIKGEGEVRDMTLGGSFLVAFDNRLFEISEDFQVGESYLRYASVGCGAEYAKGALAVYDYLGEYKVLETLIDVMNIVTTFSGGVSKPYNILKAD